MNETTSAGPIFKKWNIGDVTVTRIQENELTLPPEWLLQTTADLVRKHKWLSPNYATADGQILAAIQAFVIETDGRRIVVDTCVGNDKPRSGALFNMLSGPFLEHITLAGFPPESIDYVLCTHLHVDHVGWNTRLINGRWVPTFPNARYLFAKEEFEHAKAAAEAERSSDDKSGESECVFNDSVQPIIDAGLAELVGYEHHIARGIRLEPTPGHTPGHCCIHISSKGQEAVITGDMIHHPVQACEPDICSTFCADPALARRTRRNFLSQYSGTDVVVLGTHFADPTGVLICPDGDAWRVEDA